MKQIFTISVYATLFLLFPFITSAQVLDKGFTAGVHVGFTQAFTDVTESDVNPSFGAAVQYNVSPYIFGNVEYSNGRLGREELDIYGKSFENNFNRITATANVSLGQFLKPEDRIAHYMLYNIYAGTGVGAIRSNISKPNALTTDGFGGITYKGTDFTVPLNLGFHFKISSYLNPDSPVNFNVNLQHNFAFSEMLDGYDPMNADNQTKDSFTVLNVGMKYSFGKKKALY